MNPSRVGKALPLILVAVIGSLLLGACTSQPASAPLDGTTWNLTSYAGSDGSQVPATAAPTLSSLAFGTDGTWSGSTGCNRIAGTYAQDGGSLTMSPGPMTLMACEGPVAAQETAIVANLPKVASFTSEASLVLLASDGTALLTYAPGLTELAGTSWKATGINNGKEAVVGTAGTDKATAIFDTDGQVSGSGGCNTFSGTYTTTDPDGITFGPLAATEMACADESATTLEQQYFAALANVATYQLEADRLTLRDASGATQVTYQQMP